MVHDDSLIPMGSLERRRPERLLIDSSQTLREWTHRRTSIPGGFDALRPSRSPLGKCMSGGSCFVAGPSFLHIFCVHALCTWSRRHGSIVACTLSGRNGSSSGQQQQSCMVKQGENNERKRKERERLRKSFAQVLFPVWRPAEFVVFPHNLGHFRSDACRSKAQVSKSTSDSGLFPAPKSTYFRRRGRCKGEVVAICERLELRLRRNPKKHQAVECGRASDGAVS